MAITITRNLKLKIDSSFDDISKYNLNKIDTLASLFQINTNELAIIRSKTDIQLEPNSADVGGSGVGGSISFGTVDHPLDSVAINAASVDFGSASFALADQATGGTKSLSLAYKSDLNGSADTMADRVLQIDLDSANRNLILGGNFSLSGADFSINISALTSGQVLAYNGLTQVWENQDPSTSGSSEEVAHWNTADGAVKVISHGFSSRNIDVQIFDENYLNVEVDSIERSTDDEVTLTASQAPTGIWTVLIKKIGT